MVMKHRITKNINRIGLHDSLILGSNLSENCIILRFDWAKIDSYDEENLGQLVLGNCKLKLKNIRRTFLEKESAEGNSKINFPVNFPDGFEEVLENISSNDNELKLSGFMTIDGNYVWISWHIEFDAFEFLWNNHVTLKAWKQGALAD